MTLTATCNNRIQIDSDSIATNFRSLNYSKYEILVSVDCCTPFTILIWEDGTYYLENFNGTNTLYVYPADLGMDTFTSGIYKITLKFTNTDTGSTVEETNCKFLDYGISCDWFSYFKNQDNLEDLIGFESLYYLDNCGQCDCDKACEIYNQLKSKLYSTDGDCGCNK